MSTEIIRAWELPTGVSAPDGSGPPAVIGDPGPQTGWQAPAPHTAHPQPSPFYRPPTAHRPRTWDLTVPADSGPPTSEAWTEQDARDLNAMLKTARPTTIALVPAHNEQEQLPATLDALLAQTLPLDAILVILDNCTDGTEAIAARYSREHPAVDYFATVGNPHKKAGALNQAIPFCQGYDYVLDTDADAILDSRFSERAVAEMEADPRIGAMSAREGIKDYPDMTLGRRLIYRAVRYQRYLWDTLRMENPGDCMVVVGPGAMIRTAALNDVGGWDNSSLTEDNALSLDLREHGWRTVLGTECFVWSDSPLNLGELWSQRVRWSRGVEDYAKRPWSAATWKGKLLHKYQWLVLVWVALAIPYDVLAIQAGVFRWWFLLPLVAVYFDRVNRLRFFPSFKPLDLLFAFTLAEVAMLTYWQATVLTGTWQRIRKAERRWV
jgi:poly-beta-1,6-N-acetyl-D-glucosamine synthase